MNTLTRFFTILILCTACFSCGSGKGDSDIQDTFIGSGQADSHFDTIPLDNGDYSELKILAKADTTRFTFLGRQWLNLQIQFDGNGLYCLTFRAKSTPKEVANQHFADILQSLQKSYDMKRMVIGHSSAEGEATDIIGYRYESGNRMVQLYINENPDGTAAPILSYIEN